MQPLEERGYIIPAFNTGNVDYVDCARTLAKTLLQHHPNARVCLLTNDSKAADPNLFAYTHIVDTINAENPYANDWLVFDQTPFRQTIKLEADMIAATPVDHWWTMFEHRDVVVSCGARDFYDQPVTTRIYRKFIDENHLPDVYNAITYWRRSATAHEFFQLVRNIFEHWAEYRRLVKFSEDVPSTDFVYAMAAQIMGPEQVTLPTNFGPQIVHMKYRCIPTQTNNWTQELVWETDPFRIQTVAQQGFVHYNVKDWRYD